MHSVRNRFPGRQSSTAIPRDVRLQLLDDFVRIGGGFAALRTSPGFAVGRAVATLNDATAIERLAGASLGASRGHYQLPCVTWRGVSNLMRTSAFRCVALNG